MQSKILIIDDSESVREAISLSLKSAGYEVESASDGQDGIAKLQSLSGVGLIITDLNMPNMDGIGVVKEIRKNEAFKFLPILILTTETQNIKRLEARQAGATGWIIKPFQKEQLLQVVKKVLR